MLYLHRDAELAASLGWLIADRRRRGLDTRDVEIVEAPHRFLAGEESALAARVSGGAALPRSTPPRVFESGVDGAPTLVQNVETLAQLALLARYGDAWFRSAGTADEAGTMLATIHTARGRQVLEVPLGTPLTTVLVDPLTRGVPRVRCWWAGTTVPGCGWTGRATPGWPTPTCARWEQQSAPVCSPPFRGPRAGWSRPPGWCATSRGSLRASAGPA